MSTHSECNYNHCYDCEDAGYASRQAEVDKLTSERDALRAALEYVEWEMIDGEVQCPWCEEPKRNGHAKDCDRQAALQLEGK